MRGPGAVACFTLHEGQGVSFALREWQPDQRDTPEVSTMMLDGLQEETHRFWYNWISKSKYQGRHREKVNRSLLILKLLIYEPTGAIVAAPTFSLPEDIGGTRNWDYRYSWVRDSSFTIYILLRMGFSAEAEAYMNFISDRFRFSRTAEGALPIMFSKSNLSFNSLNSVLTISRHPWRHRSARNRARTSRRIPRQPTSPDWQWSCNPLTARHLWRAPGRNIPVQQIRKASLVRSVACSPGDYRLRL
jgi:hypothetical protein